MHGSTYVCMCMNLCICMCVSFHISFQMGLLTCTHKYTYTTTCLNFLSLVCIYIYVCMFVCMHARMHRWMFSFLVLHPFQIVSSHSFSNCVVTLLFKLYRHTPFQTFSNCIVTLLFKLYSHTPFQIVSSHSFSNCTISRKHTHTPTNSHPFGFFNQFTQRHTLVSPQTHTGAPLTPSPCFHTSFQIVWSVH